MASITIQQSHKNLIFAALVTDQTGATFKEEGSWITIEDSPRLTIPHYCFSQAFDLEGQRSRVGDSRLESAWRSLLLNKRGHLIRFDDYEIVLADEKPDPAAFLVRFPDSELKAAAELWAARGNFSLNSYILEAIERANRFWEEQAGAGKGGMMPAKVTITKDNRIRCGGCGRKVKAEYKAQDPAPCGCAWVWEGDRLVAVPSRH